MVAVRLARTKGLRLSIEDMHGLAQERGGRCLSTEYRNLMTKLRWQCARGKIWEAAPHGLRQSGAWCPQCGFEKLRLKIDDMHAIARERGGECLSTAYVNNETRLRWRCAQGHEWDAKPMRIRLGQWCPRCGRQSRMLKMTEIQALAQERGGVCLSTHYGNNGEKLRWRCANGHEWMAIPSRIKGGLWCRACTRRSYTIEDMQALAIRQGGECLSDRYVNNSTKLQWRCGQGHEWSTTPAVILKGHWCPECAWLAHSTRAKTRRKYLPVAARDAGAAENQRE